MKMVLFMALKDIRDTVNINQLDTKTLYELQKILFELGYSLSVDGIYGEETRTVFNQFKADQRLTYPDFIGRSTIDKLLTLYKDNDIIEDEKKHPSQPNLARPNTVKDINWDDFNSPISRWFTVGEVFRYDILRKTKDLTIQNRILLLATELDKIRDDWGSGVGVTSWYRPSFVNRRVGGVSNSRHLSGDAVDIYPINGEINGFQSWLDKQWFGALGYGSLKGFIHLDMRNGKGWKRGGAKGVRWNY